MQVLQLMKEKNCSSQGGYCRGFAKETLPHMWRIVQIWFDKTPSLASNAPSGGGLQLIGALVLNVSRNQCAIVCKGSDNPGSRLAGAYTFQ